MTLTIPGLHAPEANSSAGARALGCHFLRLRSSTSSLAPIGDVIPLSTRFRVELNLEKDNFNKRKIRVFMSQIRRRNYEKGNLIADLNCFGALFLGFQSRVDAAADDAAGDAGRRTTKRTTRRTEEDDSEENDAEDDVVDEVSQARTTTGGQILQVRRTSKLTRPGSRACE